MRPDVPRVLQGIAGTIATQLLPEARTPIAMQTAGLAAQLCFMIAQEFDRAAARLVEENAAILELLGRARLIVFDNDLHSRIDEALLIVPGQDLHVSALQVENDGLRALLVEVHAAAEQIASDEGELLVRLIWDELRESTRRRHLTSGLA